MLSLFEWLTGSEFSGAYVGAAAIACAVGIADALRDITHTDETSTAHGSARWARRSELQKPDWFGRISALYVGRWTKFPRSPIRVSTDRHLITIASSREGKGVSSIIPNLLTYQGSMVVIDPKGENTALTARRRAAMGHRVYVIDPFMITDFVSAAFNPLAEIDPAAPGLFDEIKRLVSAMLRKARSDTALHFDEEAEALIVGLLQYIFLYEPEQNRNLVRLRELLTLDAQRFDELLNRMCDAGNLIERCANRLLQKDPRERAGVISTAQKHTNFLDSSMLGRVLQRSDFEALDLKGCNMTIYLVLPAPHLEPCSPWLRMVIASLLSTLADRPQPKTFPVLFILDEFAALGRLEAVETAIGLMAGYGVQLWPFLQDISQLRDNYPTTWPSFLANAGVIQFFGVNDMQTAQVVSERLGRRTVRVRSENHNRTASGESGGVHYGVVSRPLLDPSEIMALPRTEQILFISGTRPIHARKLAYYKDREFKSLIPPDKKMADRGASDDP